MSAILSTLVQQGALDEADVLLGTIDAMRIDNPSTRLYIETARAEIAVLRGDLDAAHQILSSTLTAAQSYHLPSLQIALHEQLRDLAQQQNDLAGYIAHSTEAVRITEEVNGKATATRIAVQAKQRELDAERQVYEKQLAILHATLPKHIADRVAAGESVSDQFDQAAVLFLDVVNFTTNSSEMDPADVVRLLESLFSNFDELCQRHGVMKVKTIGDSYMAFKGDESPAANATSVANLALAMRDTAFTWPSGEPLTYRVGLHLGPATAGVIGTQRLQYDVWGDTVNVASRMESNALPGTINVSGDVARVLQAEGRFQLESRGLIDVKGKGAMEMFVLQHG